jgi:hypothetical protein
VLAASKDRVASCKTVLDAFFNLSAVLVLALDLGCSSRILVFQFAFAKLTLPISCFCLQTALLTFATQSALWLVCISISFEARKLYKQIE